MSLNEIRHGDAHEVAAALEHATAIWPPEALAALCNALERIARLETALHKLENPNP